MSPILLTVLLAAFAQDPRSDAPPRDEQAPQDERAKDAGEKDKEKDKKDDEKAKPEEPPVVTRHEMKVGGKLQKYTVTTGFMPLANEEGKTEARIFFMAYTLDRPAGAPPRPLMFSFNGGPGSASVWLHLGALGPKRVKMLDDGGLPAPPYELVDNDQNWLEFTDLVFIDPVGTGYSRAVKPTDGKKYWGVTGDVQSIGEFIRLYLTRYERWASPLFLVGESYGTTRAAGLSGFLVDKGIALNGVVLVSSILNFQTARFTKANDLPFTLFLPTYAATAWYHKQLPADLQSKPLREFLTRSSASPPPSIRTCLAKGDSLTPAERQQLADRLSRYTGLDPKYLDNTDLRIEIQRFCKELLRDEKRTVGRLDSRFKGMDLLAATDRPDFDPGHGRHPPALHGDVQRLRPPRPRLQVGPDVRHPGRRHRAVELGLRRRRLRRHERAAAQRVREEPAHEAVRRERLLRPGDAVLRDRIHAAPPRARPEPEAEHQQRRTTRPGT